MVETWNGGKRMISIPNKGVKEKKETAFCGGGPGVGGGVGGGVGRGWDKGSLRYDGRWGVLGGPKRAAGREKGG